MEFEKEIQPDWYDDAQCYGTSSEIFFPIKGQGDWSTYVSIAKSICARCTVQRQCLDYAIESNQKEGIWGGKTVKERRRLGVMARGA